VYIAEHRLKHKSGKWIWVLDAGKVFERDREGNPSRAVGIHMDISKQKDVEQVLLAARKSAETANRAKSVFLSNMSHELRTPLNAILGYAQIFSGDKTLTAKQQSGVRTIQQSGEHLLMLINDILDLSKIEADKMELVENEFQLPEFLQGIVNIIEVRSRAKGIGFRYEAVGTLPGTVRGDELRLRQVLLNLLSNAVKFTFKGQCTLRVHSQVSSEGRVLLTFTVEDSGVGVQPEMQEKIFEPFQQSGERLQYSEGSGLGLAISRRLVRLMGGKLQMVSPINEVQQPGETPGSRFFFTIETAVSGNAVPALAKRQRITGYTTQDGAEVSKRVLIVDDDTINRMVLREILTPLGFMIDEAVSGGDVLSACERFRPDVILMDLLMPEMDGYMATEQLKHHRDFSGTPVIAVTALASEERDLRRECLAKGFSGFIAKPYVVTDLLRILADLLPITLKLASDDSLGSPGKAERSVPPPREHLADLIHLVESGDINGVMEKAVEIETIESGKYRSFAREIQDLADEYKLAEIEKVIHSYRKG